MLFGIEIGTPSHSFSQHDGQAAASRRMSAFQTKQDFGLRWAETIRPRPRIQLRCDDDRPIM